MKVHNSILTPKRPQTSLQAPEPDESCELNFEDTFQIGVRAFQKGIFGAVPVLNTATFVLDHMRGHDVLSGRNLHSPTMKALYSTGMLVSLGASVALLAGATPLVLAAPALIGAIGGAYRVREEMQVKTKS